MNENRSNEINFESSIKRLDEISASLERENVSLEDALALYEEGVKLVRVCNAQLEAAERKIKLLKMSPDGEIVEEDLDSAKDAE
jgi:exodeoxyribonuclease VII small subunit